jgi:pimeloyl-ACP methyl ester carboxylesterase
MPADAAATIVELVLLHGQPGSAADWEQLAGRLPPRLHAVAADRPGYGSSPRPAAGFAAGARAVLEDLDAQGVDRAVLAGHSYGGGVALATAGVGHHLPRRAAGTVADAIVTFIAELETADLHDQVAMSG